MSVGRKSKEEHKQAIIEACGRYYGSSKQSPGIKIEQRLYAAFRKATDGLSEADAAKAMELGRAWWDQKAMKGPGCDW